jgi:hypothetical protein
MLTNSFKYVNKKAHILLFPFTPFRVSAFGPICPGMKAIWNGTIVGNFYPGAFFTDLLQLSPMTLL